MNRSLSRPALALVTALSFTVVGCAPQVASVSGTVTYEGTPVDNGQITFTPTDGKGAISGGPISNGNYSVADVPPGPKTVKIEAYKKVNFAASSQEMMDRANEQKKKGNTTGLVDPADVIPENAVGNNQTVELVIGPNNKDFVLTKPDAKKPGGK